MGREDLTISGDSFASAIDVDSDEATSQNEDGTGLTLTRPCETWHLPPPVYRNGSELRRSARLARVGATATRAIAKERPVAPLPKRKLSAEAYGYGHTLTNGWRVAKIIIGLGRVTAKLDHQELCTFYRRGDYGRTLAWTDGSRKHDGRSSSAAIIGGCPTRMERLPNGSSAFAAELHGILMAVQAAKQHSVSHLTVFSDCQAAITAVGDRNKPWSRCQYQSKDPRAANRLEAVRELINELKTTKIILIWVPGHHGVEGNVEADRLADLAGRRFPEPDCRRFFDTEEELPGTDWQSPPTRHRPIHFSHLNTLSHSV